MMSLDEREKAFHSAIDVIDFLKMRMIERNSEKGHIRRVVIQARDLRECHIFKMTP